MMTTTYNSTKIEGYRHIFTTKRVQIEVDVREVMMIVSAIRLKEEKEKIQGLDPFQIFEFKDTKMINKQELTQAEREFELGHQTTTEKLLCVLGMEEGIGEYWTIMFPSEY